MTVAIIAEYNPFHCGHKYHIDQIRAAFGADTEIIAVMSGNFTQRGEIAIADKYKRAEWATLGGVDLVLELPFPYSMSSAELFAKAAVKIIDSLGVVDYLSFGSESGDVRALSEIALNMRKKIYFDTFSSLFENDDYKSAGYPAVSEAAYRLAFGNEIPDNLFESNNILALEYIKAINEFNSDIKLHTVKRFGAAYNDTNLSENGFASAAAIREAIKCGKSEYFKDIPDEILPSFLSALNDGSFPTDEDKLSGAVISYFRLNPTESGSDIFDVGGGLYNRLKNKSFEANNISSLVMSAMTKKFTTARIRRSVYYSFFGVTSSSVKELPEFTQVLAFSKNGRALLKSIKERSGIKIITKPSAKDSLSERATRQKDLLDKADSVFQLTKPKSHSGDYNLKSKPFIK